MKHINLHFKIGNLFRFSMNNKLFLPVFLWVCFAESNAQNLFLKGSVRFDDNQITGMYHVRIYELAADTSLLSGNTFPGLNFELKAKRCPHMLVRISYVGYQTVEMQLHKPKADTLDLGELHLYQKTVDLKSVLVTARKPVIKTQGWKMTINVKNTTLSDAGSVLDMLKRTPGLISQGETILVPGKGAPLFIVDDREVTGTDLLNTLRSGNIESIEIDRNPSAAYSASVGSIVRIKTIHGIPDHLFFEVGNNLSIKRKVSDEPSIHSRFKKGFLSSMLTYNFVDENNVNKETYYRYIYQPDYTFSDKRSFRLPSNLQRHGIVWSTDMDLNPKNRLGFQYFFQHTRRDGRGYGENRLFDGTDEISKQLDQRSLLNRNLHSISLTYHYTIDKSSALSFVTDYASIKNDMRSRTKETYISTQTISAIHTNSYVDYDIYTLSGNYKFKLFSDIRSEAGTKYSYVNTPTRIWTDNPLSIENGYTDRTKTNDQVWAGYFTLAKDWKNFNLQLGGRYEYAQTKIRTYTGTEEAFVNRYFSDFFPNIKTGFRIGADWNFFLAYTKTVSRPGFAELNPSKYYKDSLTYSSGDPNTVPSYTHNVSLQVQWKTWSLAVTYDRIKDKRMTTYLTDESNPNQVEERPVNIRRSERFYTYLSYYCYKSRWNFYGFAGGGMPYVKIPYLNRMRTVDKFSWMLNLNAEFNINKTFTLHTDFTYESRNETMARFQYATNQWNLGIRGQFMKNKLKLDLYATDLLHGSNYNNLYRQYLNVRSGTEGTNDFRGIALKLTYTLFNQDIQVKSRRNNQDVLNRTY